MTIDWGNWLELTPAEQQARWAAYRAIIREESWRARANDYQRLNRAIYGREVARHG